MPNEGTGSKAAIPCQSFPNKVRRESACHCQKFLEVGDFPSGLHQNPMQYAQPRRVASRSLKLGNQLRGRSHHPCASRRPQACVGSSDHKLRCQGRDRPGKSSSHDAKRSLGRATAPVELASSGRPLFSSRESGGLSHRYAPAAPRFHREASTVYRTRKCRRRSEAKHRSQAF